MPPKKSKKIDNLDKFIVGPTDLKIEMKYLISKF